MRKWLAPLAAWDAPFDPEIHCTNPFKVFSCRAREVEEDPVIKTIFEVEVRNFHITDLIGLNQAYYVYSEQRIDESVPRQVRRGRVNVVPVELGTQTVRLEFVCVPPREDLVLREAADLIRIPEIEYDADAPAEDRYDADCYDPVFFSPDAAYDPGTAILARPEFFRFDPITLAVERVSITEGRVEHSVAAGGLQSGGISLQVQNPPKPVSRLRLVCNFQQVAKGRETINHTGALTTYTFDDFLSKVPTPGTPIGSDTGWTFDSFDITSILPATPRRVRAPTGNYGPAATTANSHLMIQAKFITYSFRARYDYEQSRQEILDISMPVALERPIADQRIEDVETLETGEINTDHVTPFWEYEHPDTLIRRHYNVDDYVQYNGKRYRCLVEHDATTRFLVWSTPEGGERTRYWIRARKMSPQRNRRAAAYLATDRGKRTVRYAINRLKRQVLLRARCAELSFSLPYDQAVDMSCADSIRIEVPRVGEVVGKIVEIERTIERGVNLATIRIASTNGDDTLPPVAGEGQEQTGELAYSTTWGRLREPIKAENIDAIGPFANVVENEGAYQYVLAQEASVFHVDPIETIGANPTRLIIAYQSLVEENTLTRRGSITTEPLRMKKQISFLPGA